MLTHARGPLVRLFTTVLTIALTLSGLLALSTITAPSASAAPGTVTGTIRTAGTQAPLAGIEVVAYCDADGSWTACGGAGSSDISEIDGSYSLDLPAGTFHIGASIDSNQYATAFFGGTTRANAADVVPPAASIDITMTPNPSITGRVGQGLLNSGVVGAQVCLYEQVVDGGGTRWECVADVDTVNNGVYTVWTDPGTYRVGASVADNRLRETFYAAAATVETASDLVVTNANRTGINLKMTANGGITGRVTAEIGGAAIANAQVKAYQLLPDGAGSSWQVVRTATANSSGDYTMHLVDGTYRVGFDNACPGGVCTPTYRPEFWNDESTVETADDVVVAGAATVTGTNAALVRNATISGTVKAEDDQVPVDGAQVTAFRQVTTAGTTSWAEVASATADVEGVYVLYVPAGAYRISFDDACDETDCADIYQTEYFDEAVDIDTAATIPVTGSGNYPDRNGTLARNGHITGTVTAEAGASPLADVTVTALREEAVAGGGFEWTPVTETTTDENGDYSLPAAPGTYRIGFAEVCQAAECRYLPEFHSDAVSAETGSDVTITGPDITTPDIDAALTAGSLITGSLTGTDEAPVAKADVTLYVEDAGHWVAVDEARSAADGSYAVLVPDGDFRVGFSSRTEAFTEEFYDDSFFLDAADTITVVGADVSDLDATLGLEVFNLTTPTIADADPQVGETIASDPGTWSVTPDSFTYRWFRAGSSEPIGTDETLEVPAGAVGKALTLEVTAIKAGHADGVVTTAATAAVVPGELTSTTGPTVSGSVAVGSTIQAIEGTWSAQPDAYTYEWFQDGVAMPIATTKELVVPAGAVGETLTVRVIAAKAGYTDGVAVSDPTSPVLPAGLANETKPSIVGDVVVDETLQADEGTWSDTPDSYTYRWFQAGKAEPIGTDADLVVPAGALGKAITVEVTAIKAGHSDSTATSDPSAAVDAGTLANTVAPTITGTVQVGETLTATRGTWTPAADSYTYRWFASGTADPIATGETFDVPAGVVGKALTVEVTAIKSGYDDGVASSAPSVAVAPGALASTTAPTIVDEDPQVGETITADGGTWSPTEDDLTYAWFRSGSVEPIGSGTELVVPASALGETLTLKVTATKAGYADETASSAASIAVAPGTLVNSVLPTISGTPAVGETVTADAGTWAPTQDATTYAWFQAGTAEPIASGKDLVVPASALGKTLTVEVTVTKAAYADSTESSAASAPVADGTLTNEVAPTIDGTVKVGGTVTADEGTWSPTPDDYTYRWLLEGTEQPISEERELVLAADSAGALLTLEVTATKSGYADETVSSESVKVALGTIDNTVAPVIEGTVKVGETVTATEGTWSPAPAGVTYAWFQSGSVDPIGRGRTLVVPAGAAGTDLRVEVTVIVSGYAPKTVSSQAVAVASGSLVNTVAPSISGDVAVGETLTAKDGDWSPTPDAFTYAWFQSGTDQPIGTGKELVVPAGALGKTLRVEVTAAKSGYADKTVAVDPTAQVASGALTNSVKPTITGSVTVGDTVTANPGTWSPEPDAFTYTWFQSGTATAIGTGQNLVVPVGAEGKQLTVEVTATKDGYADTKVFSEPTAGASVATLTVPVRPTLAGKALVGKKLKVKVLPATLPDGVTYRVQWFKGKKPIVGATGKKLKITEKYLGKKIRARVVYTLPGYAPVVIKTAKVRIR